MSLGGNPSESPLPAVLARCHAGLALEYEKKARLPIEAVFIGDPGHRRVGLDKHLLGPVNPGSENRHLWCVANGLFETHLQGSRGYPQCLPRQFLFHDPLSLWQNFLRFGAVINVTELKLWRRQRSIRQKQAG